MLTNEKSHIAAQELIKYFGGEYEAVANIAHFTRAVSKTLLYNDAHIERVDERDNDRRVKKASKIHATVKKLEFASALNANLTSLEHAEQLMQLFIRSGAIWPYPNKNITKIRLAELRLINFLRMAFKDSIDESVLKFFAIKQMRKHYQIALSPVTARFFNILCELISERLSQEKIEQASKKRSTENSGEFVYLDITGENGVYEPVSRAIDSEIISRLPHGGKFNASELAEFFFEVCQFVNYVTPVFNTARKKSTIIETKFQFRTAKLDAEFLLSNLFGTSTGDAGLDNLFGGAGPIFPERIPTKTKNCHSPFYKDTIGGRIVVVVGPRGSGKSLLATKIAASVAQNGGVSWVMPLEQTVNENLFMLESTGAYRQISRLNVATDLYSTTNALKKVGPSIGAYIAMNSEIESYQDFLEVLLSASKSMNHDTNHLIVIDPVNSIPLSHSEGTEGTVDLRQQTIHSIGKLKTQGINVLLVLERGGVGRAMAADDRLEFLERIADTVIELSVKEERKYTQRQIEITKSRLQREQRGKHAFSIVSGKGLQIYPSSDAVIARVQAQVPMKPIRDILFGLSDVDRITGSKSLFKGDIIAFSGPTGSYKTELALIFLLATEERHQGISKGGQISILFANRDTQNSISFLLEQPHVGNTLKHISDGFSISELPLSSLKIIELPQGNVSPGRLLQIIENTVVDFRQSGYEINRIVVDDISAWLQSSPQIRDDDAFVVAITRLLRGFRSTCLFISSIKPSLNSTLHRSIMETADCVLKFDRFWFRGVKQATVRVAKTRGRRHRLESFGISIENKRIQIYPLASLLRVDLPSGEVTPIGIRIRCYMESARQRKYYDSLVRTFGSVLSEDMQISHHTKAYFNLAVRLSRESFLDQLQIIQLEEWQLELYLGGGHETVGKLKEFKELESKRNLLNIYTSGFRTPYIITKEKENQSNKRNCRSRDESRAYLRYRALPYMHSVSMLAFRRDSVARTVIDSWPAISKRVRDWEQEDEEFKHVFFDFPKGSRHDYIALYFEILLSLAGRPEVKPNNPSLCSIRSWLALPDALEAAAILRQICHRSHHKHMLKQARGEVEYKFTDCEVDLSARIWRHTYATYMQMLGNIDTRNSVKDLGLCQLPGGISISGDSYLAIPINSAKPDTGAEIIEMLTTRDAEEQRLHEGVGLPARESFYSHRGVDHHSPLIRGFTEIGSLSLKNTAELIESGFRRSDFRCYSQIASNLARSIISLIEIPYSTSEDKEEVHSKIGDILSDLKSQLDGLQSNTFDKKDEKGQLVFNTNFCFDCRHNFSCKQPQKNRKSS